MPQHLTVIGAPADRRSLGAVAAAKGRGWAATLLPWSAVLDGAALPDAGVLRVDSPGDDPAIDRRLRGRQVDVPRGEIAPSAEWYRGFLAALGRVADEAPHATFTTPPEDIAVLFDKRRCAERLAGSGVPVPRRSSADPCGLDEVIDAARALGAGRVFVKPRYGSSGAGVMAITIARGRVEVEGNIVVAATGRPWCTLRSHRHAGTEAATVVASVCGADEVVVEQRIPKAAIDGAAFDLRVVTIAGQPMFTVVRCANHPVTNLNLGNRRGDAAAVRRRMGERWDEMMETCRRVADQFPRALHLGIDVVVTPDLRHHAVIEVNAFGDLLPGALASGRSTFEAEVDAMVSGAWPRRAPAAPVGRWATLMETGAVP